MLIALFLLVEPMNPIVRLIFFIAFFIGMFLVVFSRFFVYYEQVYAQKNRKPLFRNFSLWKRKLTDNQKKILQDKFSFYKRLSESQKKWFEHRVVSFIADKNFIGREGFEITDEVKVLISSTAVMLTFGYRDFKLDIISNIIVYPDSFYSKLNDEEHKGEFNPQMQTLVLSWKHFEEGYDIDNDNLNLGIHEFAHAIHLDCITKSGINSIIFNESFNELMTHLDSDKDLKTQLTESKYFRDYAYTNQFEFVAVLIENFIETPIDFKSEFPYIFGKIKHLLNFN